MANPVQSSNRSLVKTMAERLGVEDKHLLPMLIATAFKQRDGSVPTNEQAMALLVVANQHGLNPLTREIYAFPDKSSGIVPVVGVDGWSRITNEHRQFNGVEFRYCDKKTTPAGTTIECPEWIECVIYRKDREHPTIVREYLIECYREPFEGKSKSGKAYLIKGPWQSHPNRMLRHKSFVQCARIALGFTGIFDEDEAHNIIDMGAAVQKPVVQQINYEKIDPLITKLIERSVSLGNWEPAKQYVEQKLDDVSAAYARQRLQEAQSKNSDVDTEAKDLIPETEDAAPESQQLDIDAEPNVVEQAPMPDLASDMLDDSWQE